MPENKGMTRLGKALAVLHTEGAGVVEATIFTSRDVPRLALAGHAATLQTIRTIVNDCYRARDERNPKFCFCCDKPIRRDIAAVVIMVADCNNPTAMVGAAICSDCDGTPDELRVRTLKAIRETIAPPGARSIQPGVGHA